MTDKEKIKTEIERLKKDWQCYLRYSVESKYRTEAYSELLDFINSLPEEPVSESLNDYAKEILSWEDSNEDWDRLVIRKTAKHFTNWQKQQMMKNVIEVEVKEDAGGYPYIEPDIELYDYDKDAPTAKAGDKVKLIIIQED